LLRQVLIELLQKRRSEFHELVIEAIEEVALANAIRAGRKNEFVGEPEDIQACLAYARAVVANESSEPVNVEAARYSFYWMLVK